MTRPENIYERDYAYCRSSYREEIKIIRLQFVPSKMYFHQILIRKANWNYVVFPIDPNQTYIAFSISEDTLNKGKG